MAAMALLSVWAVVLAVVIHAQEQSEFEAQRVMPLLRLVNSQVSREWDVRGQVVSVSTLLQVKNIGQISTGSMGNRIY